MKLIPVISFCFFISLSAHAQQLSKTEELYVDSVMNANYKSTGPGAVILIAKNGQALYKKGYGLASMELNIPNKPEYVFRIGSMSKQFTAVCILQLAQEGKLSLQDDIKKYLTDYNTHGRHITIENLLSHTTGISSYTEKDDFRFELIQDRTPQEMTNFFMSDSLLFEPGTDWSYSNSGYFLAGLIVEKASGKSLTDYLQQNIFTPLGMTNSYVGTYDSVIVNSASGYENAGYGKFKPASYMSWSWPFAAGGLLTNVDDLLKWENGLRSQKILKKEWLDKAWKPFTLTGGQFANYGFGWSVSNYRGLQFITHGGAINGFLSDGIYIPSEELYIVVLSNTTSVNPFSYTSGIALQLTGKPKTKASGKSLNKNTSSDYTGVYPIHRMGSRITSNSTTEKMYRYITFKDDTLYSQPSGDAKTPLLPVSADLFISKEGGSLYHFHRDKKSKVTSLEIYNEPIQYGPNELEPKSDIALPKEKQAVAVASQKLDLLTGKYDFGGGFYIQVSLRDNHIYLQGTGQEQEEMFAENETTFFLKSVDASIQFVIENDKVVRMVLYQGGRYEAKKIE